MALEEILSKSYYGNSALRSFQIHFEDFPGEMLNQKPFWGQSARPQTGATIGVWALIPHFNTSPPGAAGAASAGGVTGGGNHGNANALAT